MPKPKYEIWLRDTAGEKLSPWDSTWDTYELAKHEISRRDVPAGAEYFIKEVLPQHNSDPLHLKRPKGPVGLAARSGPKGTKLGGKRRF